MAESGVLPAGLSTTGHPAAMAGATLWATRLSGKLNGEIAPDHADGQAQGEGELALAHVGRLDGDHLARQLAGLDRGEGERADRARRLDARRLQRLGRLARDGAGRSSSARVLEDARRGVEDLGPLPRRERVGVERAPGRGDGPVDVGRGAHRARAPAPCRRRGCGRASSRSRCSGRHRCGQGGRRPCAPSSRSWAARRASAAASPAWRTHAARPEPAVGGAGDGEPGVAPRGRPRCAPTRARWPGSYCGKPRGQRSTRVVTGAWSGRPPRPPRGAGARPARGRRARGPARRRCGPPTRGAARARSPPGRATST